MFKMSAFAGMHAVSRERHWSIDSSIVHCSMLRQTINSSVHRRHESSSGRGAAALQLRSCNQLGYDQDCWAASDQRDKARCLGVTARLYFWHNVMEYCPTERTHPMISA